MGQFGLDHSALRMKLLVVLALAAICAAEPEAEAKAAADPYLLYGGYGLGYRGYGGYYGHGLGHYGYGLGYYGKRSAEAEPEAKAATSSRALLPEPFEPSTAVNSPPCTSRETSLS